MIKITSIEDLTKLEGQDILLVKYLKLYLKDLIKQHEYETLSKHGRLFVFENIADIEKHDEIGLSQPIMKSTYEFTDVLILTDEIREIKVLHSCFLLNNDYAISLFIPYEMLDSKTREFFLLDSTERHIVLL